MIKEIVITALVTGFVVHKVDKFIYKTCLDSIIEGLPDPNSYETFEDFMDEWKKCAKEVSKNKITLIFSKKEKNHGNDKKVS